MSIKLTKILSYDMITKILSYDMMNPGFSNASFNELLSSDAIKYFSDKFSNNYKGKGVIKKFPVGLNSHFMNLLFNIVDYERCKKNDGHLLDILIVDNSNVMSKQTEDCFFDHYVNKLVNRKKSQLFLDNCEIEFTTSQKLKNQRHYLLSNLLSSDPVDLVIFIDCVEKNLKNELTYRKKINGEPLVKTIYCNDVDVDSDFYFEDLNKWSNESYKKLLRIDKLKRILND